LTHTRKNSKSRYWHNRILQGAHSIKIGTNTYYSSDETFSSIVVKTKFFMLRTGRSFELHKMSISDEVVVQASNADIGLKQKSKKGSSNTSWVDISSNPDAIFITTHEASVQNHKLDDNSLKFDISWQKGFSVLSVSSTGDLSFSNSEDAEPGLVFCNIRGPTNFQTTLSPGTVIFNSTVLLGKVNVPK